MLSIMKTRNWLFACICFHFSFLCCFVEKIGRCATPFYFSFLLFHTTEHIPFPINSLCTLLSISHVPNKELVFYFNWQVFLFYSECPPWVFSFAKYDKTKSEWLHFFIFYNKHLIVDKSWGFFLVENMGKDGQDGK